MAKKKRKKAQASAPVTNTQEATQDAMTLLNSPWGNHLISQAIQMCLWNLGMEPVRYNENPESDLYKAKIRDLEKLRMVLFPSYSQLHKTVDQHAIELKMLRMSDGEVEEIMESAIVQP